LIGARLAVVVVRQDGNFPVRRVWTFGGHTHWMTVEKDGFKNVFIKIADFSSIYPIFPKNCVLCKQTPAIPLV
jgi:hypothetical protein